MSGGAEGNDLFWAVPERLAEEQILVLVAEPAIRIERIVSTGHASPPGFWYDQDWAEWVLLLSGAAAVRFEGEPAPRALKPGSCLHIPPHVRHRVEWTSASPPAVWVAVFWKPAAQSVGDVP